MPGKVIIDLNLRTIRKTSLLWNRFPTRGTKAVCETIADLCSTRDLRLSPKDDLFGPYAKGLDAAGMTELVIEKGTSADEIRKTLNTLTDRGFGATARILPRYQFIPESSNSTLNWAQFHRDLATVDYRELIYFNAEAMFVSGFIGFWLGAGCTHLEPKVLRLSGALLGALFPPVSLISYQLTRHLYRATRFTGDCRLLVDLSHGRGTSKTKRLRSIFRRLGAEKAPAFTRNFPPEVLIKLAQAKYPEVRRAAAETPGLPESVLGKLINEDPNQTVREAVPKNPLIVAMLERAANSIQPEELADLARKPFPCVRRAAARNIQIPWEAVAYVLSRLFKDPIEGVVGTDSTNYAGPCDTPEFVVTPIYGTVGYGYVGKSLQISREILDIHGADRKLIMEKLKDLNAELYEALNG